MATVTAELEVRVRVGEGEYSIAHCDVAGGTPPEVASKLAECLRELGDALVSEVADG